MKQAYWHRFPVWIRVSAGVLLGTLFAVLLVWLATLEYTKRQEAEALAHQSSDNLNAAHTLAEHMQRALNDVELQSQTIAKQVQGKAPARVDLAAFQASIAKALPFVFQMTVNDAQGNNVLVSRGTTRLNIADREHFAVHRKSDTQTLFTGQPVRWRTADKTLIPVTYRINDAGGRFAGVLTFAIDPDYFTRFYASVVGAEDAVVVLRNDGIVLASAHTPAGYMQPGDDISQTPGYRARKTDKAGFFVTAGTLDGTTRVVGFESVGTYPLTVTVSTPLATALAPLAQSRRMYFALAALLTLLLLAAGALVVWTVRRQAQVGSVIEAGRQEALRLLEDKAQAEARVQQSEFRFQAIFEQAAVGVALVDTRSGRFERVNPMYCDLVGYGEAEILQLSSAQITCPEDLAADRRYMQQLLAGEIRSYVVEKRYRRKDAVVVWAHVSVSALWEPGATPNFHIGVAHDITEHKRAEQALRDNEQQLRVMMDTLPGYVALVDADLRYRRVNRPYQQLFGRSVEDIAGRHVREVIGEDAWRATRAYWDRVLAGEQVEFESPLLRADGAARWVRRTITPLRDEAGRLTGAIVLAQDTTAHRLAEAERRTLSRAVEQSPSSIMITDREGCIEYVNPHFEQVTGYTRAEVLGRKPSLLKSGLTDPRTYEQLWKAISSGGEWRGELCNRTQSGELFWESAAISGLTGEDSAVEHYIAVKQDITSRKRAEESRLQSQKLESLGTLAGGIAHDFNNILAAVNGNAKLALEDLAEDHAARQSVAEIAKAGTRAADLVRRIVTFGRPQESKREVIALAAVVQEALRLLRPVLPANSRLSTQFDAATPPVSADASQVHEALVNLVTNANYALGGRGGGIEVGLRAVDAGPELVARVPGLEAGRYACLSVSDEGCGIDKAILARIFDAFFTTKPVGEGTGLGLAMVHGIMKAHGGAVEVQSEPGRGARFNLYFPRAEGAAQAALVAAAAREPVAALRVMYVDDEEALVFLSIRALQRYGHSVAGFSDPVEALERFEARPDDYDIVVTDLSMPRMSGFELARRMLAVRADIPIVMTSGFVLDHDRDAAWAIGIRELVLKPDTVNDLGQILDRLFKPSAERAANRARSGAPSE